MKRTAGVAFALVLAVILSHAMAAQTVPARPTLCASGVAGSSSVPTGSPVRYTVVWHEGIASAIRVAPGLSAPRLKALGGQLAREHRGERYADVEVYDDSVSAVCRADALVDGTSEALQRHYDEHFLGHYVQTLSTPRGEWKFGPGGAPHTTIKY